MKFTDKKYLYLEDTSDNKIYQIDFYAYQIGYSDAYDDIELTLSIDTNDNSMILDFSKDTTDMFNDKTFFVEYKERDKMLKMFKKTLINYPYPNDYWGLIYENNI